MIRVGGLGLYIVESRVGGVEGYSGVLESGITGYCNQIFSDPNFLSDSNFFGPEFFLEP